ncbi:FAD-dependent monooxygenase [Rhodococcus sp. BE178]|uniref:FAD-dependent monooxygenase n=1 Tax=Rhodococcus sp. BE178 TaxID=2817737 RepID=UPI003D1AB3EB
MQFHHYGYVTTDPRIQPAAGVGVDRQPELPDDVDVLIVGGGPAGMLLAAQMSQFPTVNARLIERRPGRLEVGQADGIQARSVETFQAFGFAERITAEAYRFCATNFWAPDPDDRSRIIRTQRTEDDPHGVSEFPHLTINQARVLDYFAEAAAYGPGRITPDYGWELVSLEVTDGEEFPVQVSVRRTGGDNAGEERSVRAKYVVGTDGARSAVREAIGLKLEGTQAMHAWAVMDALTVTNFPDIRTKCAIQSENGSVLLIPREGGFLHRMYVDLGDVADCDNHAIRSTTVEQAIAKANTIMHPYTLDVRDVPWFSVYEVGHRLAKKFDDVADDEVGIRTPRVFIAGDACHTHSAKAGQGMNVSMQDTFNLGWKLGQVLTGLSPESLLDTYSAERKAVAQNLIDFDREWSAMMAKRPGEIPPAELAAHLVKSAEFTAGFMTEYPPSTIIGDLNHQDLASGLPIGKRFRSAPVVRVADANPVHLGHQARADGRWRIYAFADGSTVRGASLLRDWSEWMLCAPDSPVQRFTRIGAEFDSLFDIKVIFQGTHDQVAVEEVSRLYLPCKGPHAVVDYEKVFAVDPAQDFFDARGLERSGCVVVVRPDQYVAHVLPLTATSELTAFFDHILLESGRATAAPPANLVDALAL